LNCGLAANCTPEPRPLPQPNSLLAVVLQNYLIAPHPELPRATFALNHSLPKNCRSTPNFYHSMQFTLPFRQRNAILSYVLVVYTVHPELRREPRGAIQPSTLHPARLLLPLQFFSQPRSAEASAPQPFPRTVFFSKLFGICTSENTPVTPVECAVSKHRT